MSSIPTIDLQSPSAAQDIHKACTSIGFFRLANHGVSEELLHKVFEASKHFFSQPLEVKNLVNKRVSNAYRGYCEIGAETLDKDKGGDIKECYDLGIEGVEDPSNKLLCPNLWPDLDGFKEVMEEYFNAMHELSCRLLKVVAQSLSLEDEFFTKHMDSPGSLVRLICYPEDSKAGCGEHQDYGCMTIVAQDDVGGLQVKTKQGEWIDIENIPNTFVVNIGDLMARWTDDLYISTPHRVICNGTNERYSIPFFVEPNFHTPVFSNKYPDTTAGEYMLGRLQSTYLELEKKL